MLAEAGGLELAAELFCGRGSFVKYKKPLHGLIQTVVQGKIGFSAFGLTAVQMIFQDAYHIGRTDLPALGGDACGLDTDKDMPIFK